MKIKLFLTGILTMFLVFSACSDDSVSSNDDEEPVEVDPLVGEWTLESSEGALAVGPAPDDLSWWAITAADADNRGCLFDDLYVFNEDGSFENQLQQATWLEPWQEGVNDEACGTPVAPHDGSTVGTWEVDGSTVTISGEGLYLGLAKVHNNGEDGNPADDTISYTYDLSNNNSILEITIQGWNADVPEATWYFRFAKQ